MLSHALRRQAGVVRRSPRRLERRARPFVWTETDEEIRKKANRPATSNPPH